MTIYDNIGKYMTIYDKLDKFEIFMTIYEIYDTWEACTCVSYPGRRPVYARLYWTMTKKNWIGIQGE